MFNWDGQIVAGVIQTQQAGEVFRGILDKRAALKAEETQQQLLFVNQQQYASLVAKYNNLADRYNGVLAENETVDAAHSEEIAEKDRRIAQLIAESEERRRSAYEGWGKLTDALEEIERLKIRVGEGSPD